MGGGGPTSGTSGGIAVTGSGSFFFPNTPAGGNGGKRGSSPFTFTIKEE
jgi:hypothetical protein